MLELIAALAIGASLTISFLTLKYIKSMENITETRMVEMAHSIGEHLMNINQDITTLLDRTAHLQTTVNELLRENGLSAGQESNVFKAFVELNAIAQQIANRVPELPTLPAPEQPETGSADGNTTDGTGDGGSESGEATGSQGSEAEPTNDGVDGEESADATGANGAPGSEGGSDTDGSTADSESGKKRRNNKPRTA